MSANFHFQSSFGVEDAVLLRNDLTKIRPHTPVVIDLRDVQFITDAAIEALAGALRSAIRAHRIIGVGFEGIGPAPVRAMGVVCR